MTDVVRNRRDLRRRLAAWRAEGRSVALVPTMGALHEGHLSLVRLARERAERAVVSLFVNPSQFSPEEHLADYPRDEAGDLDLVESAGGALLYAPGVEEIYPPGFATTVTVAGLSGSMEGLVRPHHFQGVATVVAKLLAQTLPDVAVFGEKDYQQLLIIRRLALDLDLPVQIVGGPTVREDDGLALSSRNAYLAPGQRAIAPGLHRALAKAAGEILAGADIAAAEAAAAASLTAAGFDQVDYLETRDADDLRRLGGSIAGAPARILAAARLGSVRLIDNVPVQPGAAAGRPV